MLRRCSWVLKGTSPPRLTPFPPTRFLHGLPGFDCVVPEHAPDDRLTTAPQRPGLDNNPLRVCGWIGVGETADLSLLAVHQPTHAVLRRMAVHQWSVLVWDDATLANHHPNG